MAVTELNETKNYLDAFKNVIGKIKNNNKDNYPKILESKLNEIIINYSLLVNQEGFKDPYYQSRIILSIREIMKEIKDK